MNNDLIIPQITPSMARNIIRATHGKRVSIDPRIISIAGNELYRACELSPDENHLAQFIIDHNYRCVIPTLSLDDDQVVDNTLMHLLCNERAILMTKFIGWDNNNIRYLKHGLEDQYLAMIRCDDYELVMEFRDRIWVTPLIGDEFEYAMLIPRIIATGRNEIQIPLYAPSHQDDNAVYAATKLTPAYSSIYLGRKPDKAKLGIYTKFIEKN